jgi:hypothetical protein
VTGASLNTWVDRDSETGRHHRFGHLIELDDIDWKCRICGHSFDAAVDAEEFWCGEPCHHLSTGGGRS